MKHRESLKMQFVIIVIIFIILIAVSVSGCSEDNNPTNNNNNPTGNNEQILFQASEFSIINSYASWLYKDTLWQTQLTLHTVKFQFRVNTQLQAGLDSSYLNIQGFGTTLYNINRMSYDTDSLYNFTVGTDSITLAPNSGSFKIGCKNISGNAFIKLSDIKITKLN